MDIRAWIDDHILLKIPYIRRNWEAKRDAARTEIDLLKDARYVTMSGGDRGTNLQFVLVKSQDNCGPAQKVRDVIPGEGRPTTVQLVGLSEADKKARGRAWMVDHLPDECTFL
jgi:hypothetical protein